MLQVSRIGEFIGVVKTWQTTFLLLSGTKINLILHLLSSKYLCCWCHSSILLWRKVTSISSSKFINSNQSPISLLFLLRSHYSKERLRAFALKTLQISEKQECELNWILQWDNMKILNLDFLHIDTKLYCLNITCAHPVHLNSVVAADKYNLKHDHVPVSTIDGRHWAKQCYNQLLGAHL